MKIALFWLVAMVGIVQAFIGLSFFVSSIWEKERRASIFGGLQLLFMLAILSLIFLLYPLGPILFFGRPTAHEPSLKITNGPN